MTVRPGVPLTRANIIDMLGSLIDDTDTLPVLVTEGARMRGCGILQVEQVPAGRELQALETSASAVPAGYHVHALYAGDLLTMNGSAE